MNRTVVSRLSVLLPALLTTAIFVEVAQADVYRWTAPSGRAVYGDNPPERAPSLQRVDIEECSTPSCRLAETERAADAEKRHQEVKEWLDRRTEARELSNSHAEPAVYIQVHAPPYPIIIPSQNVRIHRGLHRRHRVTEEPRRHGRSSRLRRGPQARVRLH
ncbi:MAG: DUF4124 domain-containing protein [Gammaproteobacteria bacterium]|nr:DUF4124 domain-containing protein [Gammaproteobacteria bacterium]